MIKYIKNIDTFGRNIILVFLGTSVVNLFNLLFQLLIAHRLSPVDFAGFNSLLSIFMIVGAPLVTLQAALAKYSAEFKAKEQLKKVKSLLSSFFIKAMILAVLTFFIFYFSRFYITDKLKIFSATSAYILAILVAVSWFSPIFTGGLQGLELFKWLMAVALVTGALKLILVFIFVQLRLSVSGALSAWLVGLLAGYTIAYFPLRKFLSFKREQDDVNFKEIFIYLLPVAISYFCFNSLVNLDMVLVRYFFTPGDSGLYSLAQMLGKIFLFFPAAISIVMFPRASGLNAQNIDTSLTLKRSLHYAAGLCVFAAFCYHLFPSFVLKILTGKASPESIALGRLFSVSMSFFALSLILINYFLSLKDLRFVKYLVFFTLIQSLGIIFFHRSLVQVQVIILVNAILLFSAHLILAYRRNTQPQNLSV
jgi:O-antigen/teichoic acid export membrane protein